MLSKHLPLLLCLSLLTLGLSSSQTPSLSASLPQLEITWEKNILTITAPGLPGDSMEIGILSKPTVGPGSTAREWDKTTIGHKTEWVGSSKDGRIIKLRCTLEDGVLVNHTISAGAGEVDFQITARNPTDTPSLAHWAQPCIRVGKFTGTAEEDDKFTYIKSCFVYLDGERASLPTKDWATEARYVPGQVWSAPGVDRDDVNPRPLNPHIPTNGLIGCTSGDSSWTMATAFEPYQELFQGVIRCIHSDFRIGGLEPGESKSIRGKIYLQPGTPDAVLTRYSADFPDQAKTKSE